MKKSYFEASHYYVVGKHANAMSYQYVTPDGELTNSSLFAMVFDNSQEASDMAERLYHENPTFNFKSISDSGYDVLGNRITVQDDSDTWATKKMKKSTQNHSESIKKAISKRYMGDESDPDWDAGAGRWKTGGDTHVKVYQISGKNLRGMPEDDPVYQYYLKHKFREDKEDLDLSYYDQTWEGDMNVHGNLDDLYGMLQDYRPIETSRTIYSLSVGDLVEMDGRLYMVDDFGFSEVTNIKRSAKKMKKDLRTDGFTDADFEQAFKYLDEGKVYLNGNKVDWYDKNDIITGISQFCSDTWRADSIAHWVLQAINNGENFDYEDQYTSHFEVTIEKSAKKSYTPEYHDFRTMLTNMKMTRDNRTVFKR